MGFLSYAGKYSIGQDELKYGILLDADLTYPTLGLREGSQTVRVPEPRITEDGIEFLGYRFPNDEDGKIRVGRLLRASVSHITSHGVCASPTFVEPISHPTRFVDTVLRDLQVDAFLKVSHPDRLLDIAYSNALAVASFRRLDRVFLPATRVMAAILSKIFVGRLPGGLEEDESALVEDFSEKLLDIKTRFTKEEDNEEEIGSEIAETADLLLMRLRDFGPFVEVPLFPHTENVSTCSIFSKRDAPDDSEVVPLFREALKNLRGDAPGGDEVSTFWDKAVDVECVQAFSNNKIERGKEEKFLKAIEERLGPTRFKSIETPPENYGLYLKARDVIGGSSRRLLTNIMVVSNLEFEGIRKNYGVLDLQDAIQVVASKTERSDLFQRDELMKKSFSIAVLFDVSESVGMYAIENRARAVCIAEAIGGFLVDVSSCALYAFSDRLYVIKDGSEPFSRKVRARIGGVPFGGTTYMPDAMIAAAEFLKTKIEEQKILIVISDGVPYGYPGVHESLKEFTETFEEQGLIIIGIGVDTEKMGDLFRYSTAVYSQKDLIKKVSEIFMAASMQELT